MPVRIANRDVCNEAERSLAERDWHSDLVPTVEHFFEEEGTWYIFYTQYVVCEWHIVHIQGKSDFYPVSFLSKSGVRINLIQDEDEDISASPWHQALVLSNGVDMRRGAASLEAYVS